MQFLIHDRGSKFSAPYAERFVRTVRAECLDWLLIVGRRHIEHVLRSYTIHYNRERPHRRLALLTPEPTDALDPRLSRQSSAETDSAASSTSTTEPRHEREPRF